MTTRHATTIAVITMAAVICGFATTAGAGSKVDGLLGQLAAEIDASPKASPIVKAFAKSQLLSQCTNPAFVKAVKAQNAKGTSLAEIQKIDKQWRDAEDELPIQTKLMDNACAKEIERIVKSAPAIGEVFVVDNQGANVGQNALTSDYWQGDEAKWKNAYRGGHGGVDIGKLKLDKSTNVEDQKVSLPIITPEGKVIGTVSWGIIVSKLASADTTAGILTRISKQIDANGKASPVVKAFAKKHLLAQCTNPAFVKAVQAQNAKGVSLAQIQKIDKQWRDAEDELPIQVELMSNACAKDIVRVVKTIPAIGEVFVVDNQGANVGQNALTSDYWQGDEAKWKNAYKGGLGGVDISKLKLDKSTNTEDQKVSLPIIDSRGKVIGTVSWGIIVSKL